MADNDDSDTDVLEQDPPEDEVTGPPWARRPGATECLSDAALEAAVPADIATRLRGEVVVALTVRVPSAAWVAPLKMAFLRLNKKLEVFARDGGTKIHSKADVGNDEVGGHLSSGRSVVGIANSIAILPRSLVASADVNIKVRIDAGVVCAAIARFVGTPPSNERIEGLGSLDFYDIVSAFRAGSTADEIVERLRLAARRMSSPRTDRLPRLEDAVEYGPAREWGLSLGKDFAEYLASRRDPASRREWHEVGANAIFAGGSGLGKTYFARVLSAHLGIPLYATSIAEMFATSAGYLDSVVKAIRETFARAEASAPSAILWDKFDALPTRANLSYRNSSAAWWTPVITEFLTLLDSAAGGDRAGVFVWAATNYIDRIDPALIRPGRLNRVIHFVAPSPEGIASIARHHLAGELAGVDLTAIGQIGLGRSPAEIAAAVKTATRAARAEKRAMVYEDLVEALAPRGNLDAATLRRAAVHEAGHVVTAIALEVGEVVAVDIIGGADAFGRMVMRQRERIETRATIENRAVAQLGGRAAEIVIYDGDCSANAGGDGSSDLALVTEAVAGLRISMGLGDGLVYLGNPREAIDMLRLDQRLRAAVDATGQRSGRSSTRSSIDGI
jgi:cell division protease FtsH